MNSASVLQSHAAEHVHQTVGLDGKVHKIVAVSGSIKAASKPSHAFDPREISLIGLLPRRVLFMLDSHDKQERILFQARRKDEEGRDSRTVACSPACLHA